MIMNRNPQTCCTVTDEEEPRRGGAATNDAGRMRCCGGASRDITLLLLFIFVCLIDSRSLPLARLPGVCSGGGQGDPPETLEWSDL